LRALVVIRAWLLLARLPSRSPDLYHASSEPSPASILVYRRRYPPVKSPFDYLLLLCFFR
jgi:hypothetical protein